jgi:predicted enzyme related to lactoylglutathione lyase
MPEFDSYPANTPSWVDLSAPDAEKSRSFYTSLFDWDVQETGPEAGGYAMFTKNGKLVAGLGPAMSPDQPSAWMTYVNVTDADATFGKAMKAGGTQIVEPMDVMDVGRMAIFADTTGAVIGLWQAGSHKGAELANESGAFCWNELQTRDIDKAKEFYNDVFGWGAETSEMGDMAYTEWKRGDTSIGGMMQMPAEVPSQMPAYWLVYFGVDDTDASVEKANKLGAVTHVEPVDIPAGRFAVLGDPSGAGFGIIKL